MYTGEIAGLGDLPDGDEGALVEVDGLYLRVHMRIEAGGCETCSDESRSIRQTKRFSDRVTKITVGAAKSL